VEQDDRRIRLRRSREVAARATATAGVMRETSDAQRRRVAEWRAATARPGVDVVLHRLWPSLDAREGVPTVPAPPPGDRSVLLLCGVCDEVLVVGRLAAELSGAVRCPSCFAYNTSAPKGSYGPDSAAG
jgi:hypothetical protein